MALIHTIYNTVIPTKDIVSHGKSKNEIDFNGKILIASSYDIIISDINRDEYNPLYSGSLFFGVAWYNNPVTVYDDELELYTWDGRIKSIHFDWSSNKLIIKSTNYLQDMIDTTCVYSNTGNKTPAEIIYELLTDVMSIPDANINYSSFQSAINIQTASTVYARSVFTKDDGKKVLRVAEELCKITQCDLMTHNNIFKLYQYEEWNGITGLAIPTIKGNSFKFLTDDSRLINDYSVTWKDGAGIDLEPGSNAASITTYGLTKTFVVPIEDVDSTVATDFRILFLNQAAAAWAGDLAITRFKNILYIADFTLDNIDGKYDTLELGDQLDLNFSPFVREPTQIIGLRKERVNLEIGVKVLFLNLPVSVYARDTEPPSAPELIDVFPSYYSIIAKFSVNVETDLAGWNLYFTSTKGEWYAEECNLGQSPLNLKNLSLTADGYYYVQLYQLTSGVTYSVKVAAYDTSFNESAHSNILSAAPFTGADDSYYMLQGGIYTGVTLDMDNGLSGLVPDGYTAWEDIDGGGDLTKVITASFESSEYFYNEDGWTSISWRGGGDDGDVMFSYRESDDRVTWSSWSAEVEGIGNQQVTFALGYKYIQFRFLFYSPLWADVDYAIVTGII